MKRNFMRTNESLMLIINCYAGQNTYVHEVRRKKLLPICTNNIYVDKENNNEIILEIIFYDAHYKK